LSGGNNGRGGVHSLLSLAVRHATLRSMDRRMGFFE
jgi:hypothetical protein